MPVLPLLPSLLPCDVSPDVAMEAVSSAIEAYGGGDVAGFWREVEQLQRALPCVHAPLSPAQAAEVHQVMALLSFAEDNSDEAGVTLSLRAAHAAAPGHMLAGSVVRSVPALAGLDAAAARAPAPAATPLKVPKDVTVLVNGEPARAWPSDLPAIVQVRWDTDGQVHWTAYVTPDAPALDLGLLGPPKVATEISKDSPPPSRVSPALAGGAIGATAATIGLCFGGLQLANLAEREDHNGARETWQKTTIPLAYASLGVGAVAVGLDVTLLLQSLRSKAD